MKTPEPSVLLRAPQEGVHNWCLGAANQCRAAGLPEGDAVLAIYAVPLREGRQWKPREVEDAVGKAYSTKAPPPRPKMYTYRPPPTPGALGELECSSPWPNPTGCTAVGAIDLLFPGEPLLCMGDTQDNVVTLPRSRFLDHEHRASFMVPSKAAARSGMNQQGRRSKRCLEMFPKRTFVVAEWDDKSPLDDQAGRILRLASKPDAKLACVVFSGGKSLQAWFNVEDAAPGEDLHPLISAIALGADPAAKTACQLFRTPGAFRDPEFLCNRQSIHYLDPEHGAREEVAQ